VDEDPTELLRCHLIDAMTEAELRIQRPQASFIEAEGWERAHWHGLGGN
jgi:hypothetical protein